MVESSVLGSCRGVVSTFPTIAWAPDSTFTFPTVKRRPPCPRWASNASTSWTSMPAPLNAVFSSTSRLSSEPLVAKCKLVITAFRMPTITGAKVDSTASAGANSSTSPWAPCCRARSTALSSGHEIDTDPSIWALVSIFAPTRRSTWRSSALTTGAISVDGFGSWPFSPLGPFLPTPVTSAVLSKLVTSTRSVFELGVLLASV